MPALGIIEEYLGRLFISGAKMPSAICSERGVLA